MATVDFVVDCVLWAGGISSLPILVMDIIGFLCEEAREAGNGEYEVVPH